MTHVQDPAPRPADSLILAIAVLVALFVLLNCIGCAGRAVPANGTISDEVHAASESLLNLIETVRDDATRTALLDLYERLQRIEDRARRIEELDRLRLAVLGINGEAP